MSVKEIPLDIKEITVLRCNVNTREDVSETFVQNGVLLCNNISRRTAFDSFQQEADKLFDKRNKELSAPVEVYHAKP